MSVVYPLIRHLQMANNLNVFLFHSMLSVIADPDPQSIEKEAGYDEWFQAKVTQSLASFQSGLQKLTPHDEAMAKVWQRVQDKAAAA